jgi:gamma-glutamyltranspeptidase/glutathione hydrolase
VKERIDTELQELGDRRLPKPRRVGVSRKGMVSTAHYLATEAGIELFERGGNAVDAAAASAFALGVCEPAASGLGGQTMVLLTQAENGQTVALDGSSRAPNRAMPGLLGKAELSRGYRSSTVPSTPATLTYMVQRFGRFDLAAVLQPAIRLAEQGYRITRLQHDLTRRELKHLRERSAGAIFLRGGRTPYPVGSLFRQPALAATLKRLARWGVKSFYSGRIARGIAADMDLHGGLIRRDDLAQVPWPLERRPLSCRFENMRILTFPPPGSGRTLVEMLNILSDFSAKERAPGTPRGSVLLASIIRQAFRDRTDRPRDPHFYAQVEEKKMLSGEYARKAAARIRKDLRRTRSTRGETTHLSAADAEGNFVSLTQSIERVYGSCEACPELGFLYNNYMSAFESEDIGHPYYLRPNAAPWASVAPTIVFRGRRPWLAIGSPGSDRITPSILQVLLRLDKQSPYEAVEAPRLHCSLDGMVSLEASRMRSDIPEVLRQNGFEIRERDPYSFYLGCVQMVVRDRHGFIGVADPRRDGSAGGPAS